jgi:hypothetical protein
LPAPIGLSREVDNFDVIDCRLWLFGYPLIKLE